MQERLLTLAEMASRLNRSAKTFKNLVTRYNIPCYQIGASLQFDAKEVLAHLAKKKEEQVSRPHVIRTSTKKTRAGLLSERLGI